MPHAHARGFPSPCVLLAESLTPVAQARLSLSRSGAGAPELQRWTQCLPVFARPGRPPHPCSSGSSEALACLPSDPDPFGSGHSRTTKVDPMPFPPSMNDRRSGVSLTNPLTLPLVLTAMLRLLLLRPGLHFRFCRVRGTRHGYQH